MFITVGRVGLESTPLVEIFIAFRPVGRGAVSAALSEEEGIP